MRTHEGVYQVSTLPHHLAPHFPFRSRSPHFSDQEHRIQKSHCPLSAPISGQRSHVTRQTKRCRRAVLKEEPIVPVFHRDLTRYHHHRDQLQNRDQLLRRDQLQNRDQQLLPGSATSTATATSYSPLRPASKYPPAVRPPLHSYQYPRTDLSTQNHCHDLRRCGIDLTTLPHTHTTTATPSLT